MEKNHHSYRLGCDIGGTFTDFILLDEGTGEFYVAKCLTTPDDPSQAVMTGIQKLGAKAPGFLRDTKHVLHGTTLVINAIIERKGAKTALITTKGFRDVLEMRRHQRADVYDILGDLPVPLVPRYFRMEVNERVYSDGRVLIPINRDEVREVIGRLLDHGIESIAVVFLHSYINPTHEKMAEAAIRDLSPTTFLSLSSDVLPEIKEFERTSTTTINAYVKPLVKNYLDRLEENLNSQGFQQKLFLMLSGGGLMTVGPAKEFPVRLIESGPVAGALAAQYYGRFAGIDELISFDMGGTTAKACLIRHGTLPVTSDLEVDRVYRFKKGSGTPVAVPAIDLMEIGAGGGSIAEVNALGLLQVGPRSAGASPGPVCYGRGGEEPTVTDADLVLGYLSPDYFLGGGMRLDLERARVAIEEKIVRPLNVDLTQAAWGIHDLVNENMAGAVRMHVAERGGDPSRTTLVAFGGAGPVHAHNLAKKLRIPQILVPLGAGVASALGFLTAPVSFDLARTYKVGLMDAELGEIERLFLAMEQEALQILREADATKPVMYNRTADMCYLGQGYQINMPFPQQKVAKMTREEILMSFSEAYRARYGYFYPDVPVEFVNLRLHAQIDEPPLQVPKLAGSKASVAQAVKGKRKAYSPPSKAYIDYTVYDRYSLPAGATLTGPAIIEERESTTIVGEDASATCDEYGTLIVRL